MRIPNAHARGCHFNCACAKDFIEQSEAFDAVDCAGRQKAAAHFPSRKAVAFECNRIDTLPLQFPGARGSRKTASDNDDVTLLHLSATNTSR